MDQRAFFIRSIYSHWYTFRLITGECRHHIEMTNALNPPGGLADALAETVRAAIASPSLNADFI
jgi:hypothetical protein